MYHRVVPGPAIRLSVARDSIDFLDRFRPGARQELIDYLPVDTRDLILNSAGSGWLPIEHDRHVLAGHLQLLGLEQSRVCWRAGMSELSKKPLLSSVVSGTMRVFRQDKTKLLGVVPRGWTLVYREFCRVELAEKQRGDVRFVFSDIAAEVWEYPAYIDCWAAVILGLLDVAGADGRSEIETDETRRRATLRLRWEP